MNIEEKTCSKCKITKPICDFNKDSSKKDGWECRCKYCKKQSRDKTKAKISGRKYYERKKNNKALSKDEKKWVKENALGPYITREQKIKINKKNYYRKHLKKIKDYAKKYGKKNRHKTNKRERERRKNDPKFKLGKNTSALIRCALKGNKNGYSWEKLVGYTVNDLKNHLESLWEPWMNWENYGNPNGDHTDCWHIDHVVPQSWFKYTSHEDEEFKKCWALSNLQPKEARSNLLKRNKFIG